VWDINNADRFGPIEGSSYRQQSLLPHPLYPKISTPSSSYLPPPLSYPAFLKSSYYQPDGKMKVLDKLTEALKPSTSSDQVEKELKTHMDKLKTMIGKTSMQQRTEREIDKTKQQAEEKILEEQKKADNEVAELKKKVDQA